MSTFALPEIKTPWIRRYGVTVIFVVLYAFMSLLVIEQDHTINSQRMLIRQLFSDSVQLSVMKAEQVQKAQQRQAPPASQLKSH